MSTIKQNLQSLITAKSNIASAILSKGGTVGSNDGFTDFANDILTISGMPSGFDIVPYHQYGTYGSYFTFDGIIISCKSSSHKEFFMCGQLKSSSYVQINGSFRSGVAINYSDLGISSYYDSSKQFCVTYYGYNTFPSGSNVGDKSLYIVPYPNASEQVYVISPSMYFGYYTNPYFNANGYLQFIWCAYQ
jgi:hypothetical protein